MACISNTSISVLVNGTPTREIHMKRGIAIDDAGLYVLHLQYADDTVVSGLKINFNKSCLYGVGIDKSLVISWADLIKCRDVHWKFVWSGLFPLKIKILCWQILRGRLAIKETLASRGITSPEATVCLLSRNGMEMVIHKDLLICFLSWVELAYLLNNGKCGKWHAPNRKFKSIVHRSKPSEGCLKFNIDRSSRRCLGDSGIGGILRNYSGDVLALFSKSVGIIDSNKAELLAVREAAIIYAASKRLNVPDFGIPCCCSFVYAALYEGRPKGPLCSPPLGTFLTVIPVADPLEKCLLYDKARPSVCWMFTPVVLWLLNAFQDCGAYEFGIWVESRIIPTFLFPLPRAPSVL
ncbi:Uncharacterized protein TCM_036461 [Theobroma cacao]|uniref:Reverse transcriptase zinc-binding domain-containing protein n=1 Tax=Theobroma cacao TaxID=3641 RepID=A0A061FJ05_THECC|nr:Uncharacterized protein TCM_036461 [Theobroma cacao]